MKRLGGLTSIIPQTARVFGISAYPFESRKFEGVPEISKVEFESLYFAIMPCGIGQKRELAGGRLLLRQQHASADFRFSPPSTGIAAKMW
jgi:hypothetical protein